jgi:hypothetical protein
LAWDDNSFYLEQRFIGRRGFVHAIAIAKQTLVGGGSPQQALQMIGYPTPNQSFVVRDLFTFARSSAHLMSISAGPGSCAVD